MYVCMYVCIDIYVCMYIYVFMYGKEKDLNTSLELLHVKHLSTNMDKLEETYPSSNFTSPSS